MNEPYAPLEDALFRSLLALVKADDLVRIRPPPRDEHTADMFGDDTTHAESEES